MKFAMGTHVLTQLTQKTSHSSDELGALVRQLAAAAAPLEGRFNGAARVAFDEFAHNVDAISAELNAALNDVLAGIQGMDRSFLEGSKPWRTVPARRNRPCLLMLPGFVRPAS